MKHFFQSMVSKSHTWISRSGLRSQRGTEGGALVEIAVTLPLILFLMTGIFSFSVALYQKFALTEAVSAGGRAIAVGIDDSDPCQTAVAAMQAAAPLLTPSSMSITITIKQQTVATATQVTTGTCPSTGFSPSLGTGDQATVFASYPCTLGVYGVNFGSCQLNSQITETMQ